MEEKINLCIDLLEIAKAYCDFNFDKSSEILTVRSLLNVILETEKEIAKEYDNSLITAK